VAGAAAAGPLTEDVAVRQLVPAAINPRSVKSVASDVRVMKDRVEYSGAGQRPSAVSAAGQTVDNEAGSDMWI
jgi:hypothetical protein